MKRKKKVSLTIGLISRKEYKQYGNSKVNESNYIRWWEFRNCISNTFI